MLDELLPPTDNQIRRAQEIYQESIEMTEAMHITDSIIVYLQSWEFLFLIGMLLLYRALFKRNWIANLVARVLAKIERD